jgi:hypothetical protein
MMSGFFCITIVAVLIHRSTLRDFNIGKEAFLAQQARHFDEVVLKTAHSPLASLIGSLVIVGITLALYELGAMVIARFLAPTREAESQQLGQGF